MSALPHGGRIREACRLFGGEPHEWIDLSTGVSPFSYPLPEFDGTETTRLPEPEAIGELEARAGEAYCVPDAESVVAVPGSQAAIAWLPSCLPAKEICVVGQTYAEHAAAWASENRMVVRQADALCAIPATTDVAVVVNPNNPDGRALPPAKLLSCADSLAARGGALVVDEAFGDVVPDLSIAAQAARRGAVVLRSFGKFYGHPGLRLGFVIGPTWFTKALRMRLGPWPVSGTAIAVGCAALADSAWQRAARGRLAQLSDDFVADLKREGVVVVGATPLFTLVEVSDALALQRSLAAARIAIRTFDDRPGLARLGLPPSQSVRDVVVEHCAKHAAQIPPPEAIANTPR